MPYRYRCKKRIYGENCDKRVSLPKPIEDYKRPPRCPECNSILSYRDKAQDKRLKKNVCYCEGLPYPHRKASTVWCIQHPTGPTEQDYKDRYE